MIRFIRRKPTGRRKKKNPHRTRYAQLKCVSCGQSERKWPESRSWSPALHHSRRDVTNRGLEKGFRGGNKTHLCPLRRASHQKHHLFDWQHCHAGSAFCPGRRGGIPSKSRRRLISPLASRLVAPSAGDLATASRILPYRSRQAGGGFPAKPDIPRIK